MKESVYNFKLSLDWKLLKTLSQLDRFDASWASLEKKRGENLKQLKTIATIMSVGASTRIEGSQMTDEEVEFLLKNIDISKIEDRDSQEVAGYFNVLDAINGSYSEINITENSIKGLHNQLLKYSVKDKWHRGKYKQLSNAVEANFPDGTKQIIFQTTAPGLATEDAMRQLIEWYRNENDVHPLVKSATFAYEFVSIHPFQDGNGRLSRLLSILLLMKAGYNWIQYISFEHETERNKINYYKDLRSCQAQRPNEDVSDWVNFFLNSLKNVQQKLVYKLEIVEADAQLSPREQEIYIFIRNNPGTKSGQIAKKLNIPNPTVKRTVSSLVLRKIITKYGKGAGTNYST